MPPTNSFLCIYGCVTLTPRCPRPQKQPSMPRKQHPRPRTWPPVRRSISGEMRNWKNWQTEDDDGHLELQEDEAEAAFVRLLFEFIRSDAVPRLSEGRGHCAGERRGQKVRRDQDRRAHRVSNISECDRFKFPLRKFERLRERVFIVQ